MMKNIIFDMGGVIVYFNRQHFINSLNLENEEDKRMLMNEVFLSVEWVMMDRGSLDEQGCYEAVIQRLPERLHECAHKLIFDWNDFSYEIEGMPEIIRELKENGYHLYLLSNASVRQPEYWKDTKSSQYFEKCYVSAFLHHVKPEKEIYDYVIEENHLEKEECVFIDDSNVNVEGAIHAGLHAIVYLRDNERLKESLRTLGVRI